MTFYWWSHWFWITLLSNILMPITIVHTYPSQEVSQTEYNQNSQIPKVVTKLYQATTTTIIWATTPPPMQQKPGDAIAARTKLQNVTPEVGIEEELPQSAEEEYDDELPENHMELEEAELESASDELEFKRSAENFNQSNEDVKEPQTAAESINKPTTSKANLSEVVEHGNVNKSTESVKLKREETEGNNYTNFSSAISTNSSSENITAPLSDRSTTSPNKTNSSATISAAAPSTPKIEDGPQSPLDWFNVMAPPPPAHVTVSSDDDSLAATTVDHKVPFTLENVNKEDELRRAENEHRSRKSKELSAEYKHINRFINFSTDSKNLLARSASTAPNEYENDEGNISSEALAIQRTYFLDAGAISAICLTVFGVCCTVGTIGIVLYRRRYLNKPQALSEPDSSVYIDDSTMRVSDNSDEMYSLDNDSFLNSLEAMTIQNYWTDTVKHTKL